MIFLRTFYGPYHLIAVVTLYLIVTATAIYFVFKKEQGISKFLWTIAMLMMPLVSIVYLLGSLMTHFVNKRRETA